MEADEAPDQNIIEENESKKLDDTMEANEDPVEKVMKWKHMKLLYIKSAERSSYIQVAVNMIYFNQSR